MPIRAIRHCAIQPRTTTANTRLTESAASASTPKMRNTLSRSALRGLRSNSEYLQQSLCAWESGTEIPALRDSKRPKYCLARRNKGKGQAESPIFKPFFQYIGLFQRSFSASLGYSCATRFARDSATRNLRIRLGGNRGVRCQADHLGASPGVRPRQTV